MCLGPQHQLSHAAHPIVEHCIRYSLGTAVGKLMLRQQLDKAGSVFLVPWRDLLQLSPSSKSLRFSAAISFYSKSDFCIHLVDWL